MPVGQLDPRRRWHIENRLHWVRDVTFDEDRSQVRTGNGPRVMATLRNLVISLLRFVGTETSSTGNSARSSRYRPPMHAQRHIGPGIDEPVFAV